MSTCASECTPVCTYMYLAIHQCVPVYLDVYNMLLGLIKVQSVHILALSPDDVIHQRDRCAGIQVTSTAVTYKRPNITL